MKTKQELLADLQEGLSNGILTESDIRPFVASTHAVVMGQASPVEHKHDSLSVVDIMFYIAGIVMFSTIMSIIIQSWSEGNPLVHILLSAGIGMGLWTMAYYLINSPFQNEIRKGLTNALLLTGSLLLVVGGYIIINEIIGGYDEVNFIPAAFALAILGGVHVGFDRLIKRKLVLLMGIFLAVSAFPTLLLGFLQETVVTLDLYAVIFIISASLLVYATRVVDKLNPDRQISNSFDTIGAFLILMSMYVASYSDYGITWLAVLIAAVFGIFYLSIILQNKHLLGNGSFFMVLTIITISFKYFSGYGATLSLIIATLGLLGSAAVASSINKKYFKEPTPLVPKPNSLN